MSTDMNVAIIGAGQAGLATSYFLKQANVDHVVLDAGRVAETWRSRRWDSFCLVTPNWSVQLPGAEYRAPDPDGFMGRDELVDYIQRWSESFDAPVREDCSVSALDLDADSFLLTTSAGQVTARSVVVATGGYQRAHRPRGWEQVPARVTQLLAEEYRNEASLRPGAVLIVGGGQTGCQLAEELHQAGREVILSCGRAPWAPRRFGGHDLVWWIVESGFWNRTLTQLPYPAARLFSNPLATGHGGGHDLHYRTLHAMGVELAGRFAGADDEKAYFDDDLARSLQAGDDLSRVFAKWVAAFCEKQGIEVPWHVPEPITLATRKELDLDREGIATIIWTTGFRPDYRWVHADVLDDMGFPIQTDGRSETVPGLYFMGVHFQRKAQSAVLYGVGEDAEIVAEHIKENRA